MKLIKSYSLPISVNKRDIKPTVIKKANQTVSFKFCNVQLLDILNFFVGVTNLDSFLKAHKKSEAKDFIPYDWFNSLDILNEK